MPSRRGGGSPQQRAQFGAALRSVLEADGINQTQLAEALGGLAQSTVSAWLSGSATPVPDVVFRIEAVLGIAAGTLSRHLGYLPAGEGCVEAAIAADPHLQARQRSLLLAHYRELTGNQRPAEPL